MPVLRPCLDCGEPTTASRCQDCKPPPRRPQPSSASRGYDQRWRTLSEKARKLQPWCTDCGATDGLQLDHLPEAWERTAKGLPIRLGVDAEVCCGPCNRARGAARGSRADQRRSAVVGSQPDEEPSGTVSRTEPATAGDLKPSAR